MKSEIVQFPKKCKFVEKSPIVKQGDPKTSPIHRVSLAQILGAAFNTRHLTGNKEEAQMLKQLVDLMWANHISHWCFSQQDWDKLSQQAQEQILM